MQTEEFTDLEKQALIQSFKEVLDNPCPCEGCTAHKEAVMGAARKLGFEITSAPKRDIRVVVVDSSALAEALTKAYNPTKH